MPKDKPILELADFTQAHLMEEILREEGIDHRIELYNYIGNFPGNPRPWTLGNYGRLWAFAADEGRIYDLFNALQKAEIIPEDNQEE